MVCHKAPTTNHRPKKEAWSLPLPRQLIPLLCVASVICGQNLQVSLLAFLLLQATSQCPPLPEGQQGTGPHHRPVGVDGQRQDAAGGAAPQRVVLVEVRVLAGLRQAGSRAGHGRQRVVAGGRRDSGDADGPNQPGIDRKLHCLRTRVVMPKTKLLEAACDLERCNAGCHGKLHAMFVSDATQAGSGIFCGWTTLEALSHRGHKPRLSGMLF